jgi:Leucine-rich repeat (LRR) protein
MRVLYNTSGNKYITISSFNEIEPEKVIYIDCSNSNLELMPDMNYPLLKYLDCSNNRLTLLPKINCPNLFHIDASFNNFSTIYCKTFNINVPPTLISIYLFNDFSSEFNKIRYIGDCAIFYTYELICNIYTNC